MVYHAVFDWSYFDGGFLVFQQLLYKRSYPTQYYESFFGVTKDVSQSKKNEREGTRLVLVEKVLDTHWSTGILETFWEQTTMELLIRILLYPTGRSRERHSHTLDRVTVSSKPEQIINFRSQFVKRQTGSICPHQKTHISLYEIRGSCETKDFTSTESYKSATVTH